MPARSLLIAALLLVVGCNIPGPEGADCVDDEGCDETEKLGCWHGTCQRLATIDGPLGFEVIPRTSLGLGPVALAPATTAGGRVELSVCPPERVAGDVELPAAYPVEVEAVATTALPGVERRFTTILPADPAAPEPRPFTFSLPPASWRLRFTSGDRLSPPLFAEVEVKGCAPVPAIHVAPPARFTRELRLRFGPGPVGHCGAAVQAFDPASGLPLTAEAESRGNGDSCPEVRLVAWIDDVERPLDLILHVKPAAGSGAVASQRLFLRAHPEGLGLCPPDTEPPCPMFATIELLPPDGDLPTYLGPVTVEAVDEAGLPFAPLSRVIADGLLDGVPWRCDPEEPTRCGWGQGSLPATFHARESGPGPSIELPLLLPGRYGFTLIPAAGSDFAITRVSPAPVSASEPVRIPLARKQTTTGRVVFEGEPLPAVVRAEPLDGRGRTATYEAGDDGRFRLSLDPGSYRLEVRPRDYARKVPWASVELPESAAGGSFDIAVPPRARVQGRVKYGAAAVALALVRVYRCEPDCSSAGATAIAVGEGITEADGTFAVLVPGL